MGSRRVLKSGRRRARKRGCFVEDFTGTDLLVWWELMSIDSRYCYWCGGPYESADHVMPIALGGHHSFTNIVPCCHGCNNRKDSMHPLSWIATLVMEDDSRLISAQVAVCSHTENVVA